jgi:hypothetical protein
MPPSMAPPSLAAPSLAAPSLAAPSIAAPRAIPPPPGRPRCSPACSSNCLDLRTTAPRRPPLYSCVPHQLVSRTCRLLALPAASAAGGICEGRALASILRAPGSGGGARARLRIAAHVHTLPCPPCPLSKDCPPTFSARRPHCGPLRPSPNFCCRRLQPEASWPSQWRARGCFARGGTAGRGALLEAPACVFMDEPLHGGGSPCPALAPSLRTHFALAPGMPAGLRLQPQAALHGAPACRQP